MLQNKLFSKTIENNHITYRILGIKFSVKNSKFYKQFKPVSALLLEDTRVAVDKLRQLLRNIDLTEVDDKGKPIYTLNTVTATIKQIPSLVKDLDEAEKAIAKEIMESDKVRGAQEKSMYEDF